MTGSIAQLARGGKRKARYKRITTENTETGRRTQRKQHRSKPRTRPKAKPEGKARQDRAASAPVW
jgi:hypothetical protein